MSLDRRNRSIRVLVTDDQPFARAISARVLTQAGIEHIEFAESGAAAIARLQRGAPMIDVIFCDLVMPDMDGVELVRHVAELSDKPAVIFLSGASAALLTVAVTLANARGLRVLGAIEKPMSVETALAFLDKLEERPAGSLPEDVSHSFSAADLEQAIAQDQIILHYQPKVSLASQALRGFESLVRWQHPQHGLIAPGSFVPLAEESGTIAPLTDRILQLALRQCATWNLSGLRTKVSVNLSAQMLVDLRLPDRISAQALAHRVEPKQVILEITETGVLGDSADTLDILARLHMKGFPLSIDDFGTGYSAMDQLRRVPFSELKIDRAFVNGAARNAKARAILEASASLAHKLGLVTVAEGAEDGSDWDSLTTAGIDLVQGYYVAKPMAAPAATAWARAWRGLPMPHSTWSHS